jgi:hypothetical protein
MAIGSYFIDFTIGCFLRHQMHTMVRAILPLAVVNMNLRQFQGFLINSDLVHKIQAVPLWDNLNTILVVLIISRCYFFLCIALFDSKGKLLVSNSSLISSFPVSGSLDSLLCNHFLFSSNSTLTLVGRIEYPAAADPFKS